MKKLIGLFIFLSANCFAADIPDYITACADCHGENGISSDSDVPIIAGASDIFLSETMVAYKEARRLAIESKYRHGDTERPATDMQKIAKDMTDEQIEEIATHFASLEFIPAKQEFDPVLAEKGAKIHDIRCKKCHEDGGSSVDDDSGILAGQWTPYLRASIKHFRSGERAMQKKMKVKVDQLDDDAVEALLHYYASQQ